MTDFLLWTVVLLTHSRNINGALAEGNVEYFFSIKQKHTSDFEHRFK